MRWPVGIALLLTAVVTSPASAAKRSFGSPLKASATVTIAKGADTAFWHARVAGGGARVPATGQILKVRIKGSVLQRQGVRPLNEVHIQHLAPAGGGKLKVVQTSQAFRVPIGGMRDRVTTFSPTNLCAHRGDTITFNVEGGFDPPAYPNGAPFRVFGAVGGSSTASFTGSNGTNNGTTIRPASTRQDVELLMQLVLGTGRDVGGACKAFNQSNPRTTWLRDPVVPERLG